MGNGPDDSEQDNCISTQFPNKKKKQCLDLRKRLEQCRIVLPVLVLNISK